MNQTVALIATIRGSSHANIIVEERLLSHRSISTSLVPRILPGNNIRRPMDHITGAAGEGRKCQVSIQSTPTPCQTAKRIGELRKRNLIFV
jgi:hypothetical protein